MKAHFSFVRYKPNSIAVKSPILHPTPHQAKPVADRHRCRRQRQAIRFVHRGCRLAHGWLRGGERARKLSNQQAGRDRSQCAEYRRPQIRIGARLQPAKSFGVCESEAGGAVAAKNCQPPALAQLPEHKCHGSRASAGGSCLWRLCGKSQVRYRGVTRRRLPNSMARHRTI